MKSKHMLLAVFIVNLLLAIGACSKNNNSTKNRTDTVFGNSFTYIVTDTVGLKYNFSDTTMLLINNLYGDTTYTINGIAESGPAAYISQIIVPNNNSIHFVFSSVLSPEENKLIFNTPYYQNKLSINSGLGNAQFVLALNHSPFGSFSDYTSTGAYFDDGFINILVNITSMTTKITDSIGGFVSGTFDISANTLSSNPIQVSGSFTHVSNNFQP